MIIKWYNVFIKVGPPIISLRGVLSAVICNISCNPLL